MRGGFRQNAGRKQGFSAKRAEKVRLILSKLIMREIQPIGEAIIAKAKNGDIQAVKELFDRAFGRSPQSVDVTSGDMTLPIPIIQVPRPVAERFGLTAENNTEKKVE